MRVTKHLFVLCGLLSMVAGHASRFTPGDLLVSEGDGGPNVYTVAEYTPTGALVQRLSVPTVPGEDEYGYNRGMTVDGSGRLIVFCGTFSDGLAIYDPVTSRWTTVGIPGDSIVDNGSFGKIAAFGHYVFLPDHATGYDPTAGIIRYDTSNGTWTEFASDTSPESIDLNIGPDGLLYSLDGAGSPSGTSIAVFNPNTLAFVRSIDLSNIAWWTPGGDIVRDAIPRADGNIWLNQLYSPAFLVDGNGNLLNTYTCQQTSYIDDFDVAPKGMLAQIDFDGHVYLYDSNFNPIRDFQTSNYYWSESFGTFVPAPEPASIAVLGLGLAALLRRKRTGH